MLLILHTVPLVEFLCTFRNFPNVIICGSKKTRLWKISVKMFIIAKVLCENPSSVRVNACLYFSVNNGIANNGTAFQQWNCVNNGIAFLDENCFLYYAFLPV